MSSAASASDSPSGWASRARPAFTSSSDAIRPGDPITMITSGRPSQLSAYWIMWVRSGAASASASK